MHHFLSEPRIVHLCKHLLFLLHMSKDVWEKYKNKFLQTRHFLLSLEWMHLYSYLEPYLSEPNQILNTTTLFRIMYSQQIKVS